MPTRTTVIHEWGSEDTVWISHESFIELLSKAREKFYSHQNGTVARDDVKEFVQNLHIDYESDKRIIMGMSDSLFDKWFRLFKDQL